MGDDHVVELRGAECVEDATLADVWVAGQPLGKLVERQRKRIDELESKLEAVEETATTAEQKASTALGTAHLTDDGARADGSVSKTRTARQIGRNYLVKKAINGNHESLRVSRLIELCEPQHEIAYQQAKNATRQLAEQWRGLAWGENQSGNKALLATPAEFSKELVSIVEEDLETNGLTKRFISQREGEGGK